MTIEIFLFLFTIGSLISSLLTEAIKKMDLNMSVNIIALIDAMVVGFLGTIAFYLIMGIVWTPTNIVCIFLMTFCIWIGSMIGYDKVMQTIAQLKR
jgi:hypothetical protein